MPLYDYKCQQCGEIFEVEQRMSDPLLEQCIKCQGRVMRLISPVGIVFKGSGFYVTDNKPKPAEPKSATTAPAAATSSVSGAASPSAAVSGGSAPASEAAPAPAKSVSAATTPEASSNSSSKPTSPKSSA